MKTVTRPGPLPLVLLVGLALLNCVEKEPTAIETESVTTTVQSSEATTDALEIPTLTATELLRDPTLDVFLEALTIRRDADKIRRAMDAVVADLEDGDAAKAEKHFADARTAVADYGASGELDPDDDIHLDLIDFFFDGVEELLPEAD